MENARIIKLDSPLTVTAVNFEEAFGEYSEAAGRRQRRFDRKMDKTEKRKQLKAARQEKRRERQQARIENRRQKRIARQQLRADVQSERLKRRQTRAEARQLRRGLRKGQEQQPVDETEEGTEEEITQGGGAPQGGLPQEFGAEEGGFESNEVGEGGVEGGMQGVMNDLDYGTGEGTIEPPEYGEEGDMPEEGMESFIGADGYYDFFTGEGITDSNIDYENLGSVEDIYALQPDDFYTYSNGTPETNFDGTGSERFRINPKVQNAANKSEWNKEMANRLTINLNKINEALAQGIDSDKAKQLGIKAAKISQSVILHKARASSFDAMLSNYAGFDGIMVIAPSEQFDDGTYDDSANVGTDEIMSYANGKKRRKVSAAKMKKMARASAIAKKKRISKKELGRRRAEVRAALTEARKGRLKAKGMVNPEKAKQFADMVNRKIAKQKLQTLGVNPKLTAVSSKLDAKIGQNRIVIPPQGLFESELFNGADGTGLIAIDDAGDYDAPTGISYETMSGADGSKVNLMGILVGVALAGGLIWAAKKYNWIK